MPNANRRLIALTVLVAAGGLAGTPRAIVAAPAERIHLVRVGESASSISMEHYGIHSLGDVILRHNDKQGTTIRPGEKLRIPYCETHVIKTGDTWSALAGRYLDSPSAYPAIARLNGLSPRAPLRVGQSLTMPAIVDHRLGRGETLATLAESYYGNPLLGDMLQEHNRIENPRRLSVGQIIEIPLVSLKLREGPTLEAAPNAPAIVPEQTSGPSTAPPVAGLPAAKMPRSFDAELRAAADALMNAQYRSAREELESLRGKIGPTGNEEDRAEMWRLLLETYVALDLQDRVCIATRSLENISRDRELDPDLVSPKIREAVSRCDNHEI